MRQTLSEHLVYTDPLALPRVETMTRGMMGRGADAYTARQRALSIIDRLWKGETITEEGRFYTCRDLKLHTLSERRVPIWVSAFGPQAGEVAAKWGDGIWTLPDPESTPELLEAWRDAGGSGEVVFQALFSWAEDDQAAMDAARKWKGAQPQEHLGVIAVREVLEQGVGADPVRVRGAVAGALRDTEPDAEDDAELRLPLEEVRRTRHRKSRPARADASRIGALEV